MRSPRWRTLLYLHFALHVVAAIAIDPILVAEIAILETVLTSWAFVGIYSFRDWRSTPAGKLFMALGVLIALLVTVSVIPESLGFDGELREWVAALVIFGMATLSVTMVHLTLRYRPAPRRDTRQKAAARAKLNHEGMSHVSDTEGTP